MMILSKKEGFEYEQYLEVKKYKIPITKVIRHFFVK